MQRENAGATGAGTPTTKIKSNGKVLVFRNVPSWNRKPDFEEVLTSARLRFDVKPASAMKTTDLKDYRLIIIPGAQWQTDFYRDYNENAKRFDDYVAKGGTLVFELNGAENSDLVLPLGVRMTTHGAFDNEVMLPKHPILLPLGGQPIHANFASHGYLTGVPNTALILAAETTIDGEADEDRPTFIEYSSGKGRVIAACQCFHDQSGRGPLMKTLVSYAMARKWFSLQP
jgi:hypothetical protein